MPVLVATHDGPFHADDVMAFAMIRTFFDAAATVVRTRDLGRIAGADVVIDVGGVYDPPTRRFDHHQTAYQGPWSAAGMVLEWLTTEGHVATALGGVLRRDVMDYLDAVDNGRVAPRAGVPCFPRIVEAFNHPAGDHAAFDRAYLEAVSFAQAWLRGLVASHQEVEAARVLVRAAMDRAVAAGQRILVLTDYVPWKEPYFENGGREHPTDYVVHPGTDGSWRIVAIPPELGSMAQKRPLPESWAGLTDAALEAVTGVPGSKFCHKNRFIAVFQTRAAAFDALDRWGLLG
jgi:uncharacterized UPF0160 family protein